MSAATRCTVFERVVCGVDSSDAGRLAARAAARVAAPDGVLTLVTVNDTSDAVHAGWAMPQVLEQLAAEAVDALERGRREAEPLHAVEATLFQGDRLAGLLGEVERCEATLVVVGTHGVSRLAGVALGALSTRILHDAPCSVLVARGPVDRTTWPKRIVAGVDGSPEAACAYEAASALAERCGAALRVVTASADARVDLDAVRALAAGAEEHDARPLDLLGDASAHADLVVVGSRGLRGLRSLGSLSERLAHEAACSVLVVRPSAAAPPTEGDGDESP